MWHLGPYPLWDPCPGSVSSFLVGSTLGQEEPHFLDSFPETLTMPSDPYSGHSGSGKTETARKLVEFLSSLQQEPRRDRGCQVRGHWHDLASKRDLPLGQPLALPAQKTQLGVHSVQQLS